MVYRFM